jgi:hypothetical protein
MLNEQAKLADHEQPKLLSADIHNKMEELKREVNYLLTKIKYFRPKTTKKPEPEPAQKKSSNSTEQKPNDKDESAKTRKEENDKSEEKSSAENEEFQNYEDPRFKDIFDKEETTTTTGNYFFYFCKMNIHQKLLIRNFIL